MLTWFTQSYWRDEAFSVLLAQKPIIELIRITAEDFSPPLYYLVLKLWMQIFGASEIATRSLSLVFFCATLVALIFFAIKILHLSPIRAIISISILCFLNLLLLLYSAETRMYTMVAFIATLSWYFFLKKRTKLYIFVTVLGLFTHYFMVLILLTQALYTMFLDISQRSRLALHSSRYISIVITFLIFLPWLIFSLVQHKGGADTSSFWIPKPGWGEFWVIPGTLISGYTHGILNANVNLYPLTYVFWAVVGISLLDRNRAHIRRVIYLGIWAFIPAIIVWVASQFTTPLFLSRYLIISAPAVVLLLAVAISRYRPLIQLLFVILTLITLYNYQVIHLLKSSKENLKVQIHKIETLANKNDYLIVESELDYHVAQIYWFDKDKVKIVGKTYAEIPTYVGKCLIPPSAIIQKSEVSHLPGFVLRTGRQVIPNQAY